MLLYLFDFHDTLSTVPNPASFLRSLKKKPGVFVVVMSGGEVPNSVVEAADEFWPKDGSGLFHRLGGRFYEVILSDDNELFVRAITRNFGRKMPEVSLRFVHPRDLLSLSEELD